MSDYYLDNKVNKLESIVLFLAEILIKDPVQHDNYCKETYEGLIKTYGKSVGHLKCRCLAEEINDLLKFTPQSILTSIEIQDAHKIFLKNKKSKKK